MKRKRKRGRQKKRWEDISKSGQEWTLPSRLGQLKTGQDGKGLLRIHLWCPDDLPRLWDRIEYSKRHKSIVEQARVIRCETDMKRQLKLT